MGEPQHPPPPYEQAKNAPMYPEANAPQEFNHQSSYQPSMTNPYPQNQQYPPQHPQQNPQPQPLGSHTRSETYIYVTDGHSFGPVPAHVTCPHCHQQTTTKINYSAGVLTWVFFGLCLFFGCWFGCCLIPFCMDSCQDCDHFCSNCNAFLGHYKRL